MKGSREIGFTILSMTISLAAVFIPIVFMGGIVGRLLHEFAVTIILAILFSGIVSVTLTPMLCSRMLRDEEGQAHNAFYRWSERTFNRMQDAYERTLRWSLDHRPIIFGMFFASIVATVGLFSIMQQDFLPSDDTEPASVPRSEAAERHLVRSDGPLPAARSRTSSNDDPNVEGVMSAVGAAARAGTNTGFHRNPSSEAAPSARSASMTMIREIEPEASADSRASTCSCRTRPPSASAASIRSSPYQYTMQDLDLDELQDVSDRL